MNKFIDYDLKLNFEEYLALDAVDYSTLKSISTSGAKAIREKEEVKGTAINKGNLTEDLLFFPEEVGNKYYINTLLKYPTASSLILADKLAVSFVEKGITELKEEDFNPSKWETEIINICETEGLWTNQKTKTILTKDEINNIDFWRYINLQLKKDIKKIVSIDEWNKADELTEILKSHRFTKELFKVHSEDIEILKQFAYKYNIKLEDETFEIKILIDYLIVDHKEKKVYIYDLKTGTPNASAFLTNYYIYKYYLQGGLYAMGISHLLDRYFKDYTINNNSFSFIYISTSERNPYPIIWTMDEDWIERSWEGFINRGIKVKGIKELLKEYSFYKKYYPIEDKQAIDNNGVIEIPFDN